MVSFQQIMLEYVVPSAGVVTANAMALAAYRDVRKAVLANEMGELNPTPWAFLLGNCFGWVSYSFIVKNMFVFFANAPGFLLSVWLNMAAIKLQFENHHRSNSMRQYILEGLARKIKSPNLSTRDPKLNEINVARDEKIEANFYEEKRDDDLESVDFGQIIWDVASENKPAPASHERLLLCIVAFWCAVWTILVFGSFDRDARELGVGLIVNLNLIFFYGAPLSTIRTVLRMKTSASIHATTMYCNLFNSTLWTFYGFTVGNLFILVPNGLGTTLGALQIILYFWYPARDKYDAVPPPPPLSDVSSISTTKVFTEEEKRGFDEATPLIIGSIPGSLMIDWYQMV